VTVETESWNCVIENVLQEKAFKAALEQASAQFNQKQRRLAAIKTEVVTCMMEMELDTMVRALP
jgi:hypothetical protein